VLVVKGFPYYNGWLSRALQAVFPRVGFRDASWFGAAHKMFEQETLSEGPSGQDRKESTWQGIYRVK